MSESVQAEPLLADVPDPPLVRHEWLEPPASEAAGGVVQEQFREFRGDLDQVRAIVADAVLKLQDGFIGMRTHIQGQEALLGRILERLTGDGATDADAAGLQQFAAQTTDALGRFVDHVIHTSKNSMDILHRVEDVAERLEEVHRLANSIDRIARHVKMVSLNASIEAARAGDAGAGFGVVAQEVRRLAGETDEISAAIRESVARSRTDVAYTRQVVSEVASIDMNFALDIRGQVDAMIEEAGALNGFVAEQARAASDLSRNIQTAVSLATMALQFEDVVNQVLGHLDRRFEATSGLVASLVEHGGAGAPAEAGESSQAADAIAAAVRLHALQMEALQRRPAGQQSLDAGEITLF